MDWVLREKQTEVWIYDFTLLSRRMPALLGALQGLCRHEAFTHHNMLGQGRD